jgi:SAM-dependent methyltransferase
MSFKNKKSTRTFYEQISSATRNSSDSADLELKFQMLKPSLDKIPIQNRPILDLGCGNGGILEILQKHYHCIPIGADLSFRTLQSEPIRNFQRFQVDAERLSLREDVVELIYFIDLLEHLPNPTGFLQNIVTCSANVLMFIPLESAAISNLINFYRRFIGKPTSLEVYGHIQRFDFGKIRKLLKCCNMPNYTYTLNLYDNFSKHKSFKGRFLDTLSKFCYRLSPFFHRKLFGGWTCIILVKKEA